MQLEYSAELTKKITGYVRTELQDLRGSVILVDDKIHEAINRTQNEIAERTFCYKDDIIVELEPKEYELKLVDIIDSVSYITRVDRVVIVRPDGTDSKPLKLKDLEVFEDIRTGEIHATEPVYNFDETSIFYWEPVTDKGYKMKIKCCRRIMPSEYASYSKDPVISPKYIDYLGYGAVAKIVAPRKEYKELFEYYQGMYKGYKTVRLRPTTLEIPEPERKDF